MPFAPFVGVNHHRQSIVFGVALLEDEMEATFTWLFEHFLHCMFDMLRTAIITGQFQKCFQILDIVSAHSTSKSMLWSIYNPCDLVTMTFMKPTSIGQKTIEDFEAMWLDLNEKYDQKGNCWIQNMYNLRAHWAKSFLKDTFFAGMTTSGRSESIHSFST
ncbi:LOW QUALITY PROTEIN: hypothetical protein RJ639_018263, partial [Escallonia herrerae]